MFRINPFKTYREEKHVPNNVSARTRTKPITVSQPSVITKKEVNSDSNGCSKHMTGNLKLLINFVWKFMGTVCFENDHVAVILGFGDLQWRNILITKVYFVEGLGHNLFSVGQFCDSDLKVAFRRNACFVKNLEGVDLLKGDRSTNLYTINLHEMASASPICLMACASSTKSWLWHQRLYHLNFDTINDLARNDLVSGLPKFKYHKEHLYPSCEPGKSKRASHPPKQVSNSRRVTNWPTYSPKLLQQIVSTIWFVALRSTHFYWLSHSEIVDTKKVAVHSSLRVPNNKCALIESRANESRRDLPRNTTIDRVDVL
nr:retrovirus-related Pol polyprotein from transposon TNT 1-94 [Tanacetum cinerariifolium]